LDGGNLWKTLIKERGLWDPVWKGLKKIPFSEKDKNSFLFSASSNPKKPGPQIPIACAGYMPYVEFL